ncbi:MAG: hypothetical protein WCI55_02055 [Armatimonadota bacterium]
MDQAHQMPTVTIAKSKLKVLLASFFMAILALVALGMGFLLGFCVKDLTDGLFLLGSIVFLLEAVLCLVAMALLVRFAFDRKPGIILTNDGFTFWHMKAFTQDVSWSDVERIEFLSGPIVKLSLGGFGKDRFKFVNVFLRPNHGANVRGSKFKRLFGPGDIVIEHRYLSSPAKDIFESMNAYWAASKGQANISELSKYPR